ncbi:19939_t:CDS:2 [Racocetra persica]|uniref:19939_t:CDS:1 n=1 Tax=Racocetra persica TaxID=160502 RepID=A0ACA9RL00_9GLOM|nr:19939_t:CDS:2 [Racocetra persica]
MSQANTEYLAIRKRALIDFEKALEFSLKKFNDIQRKDKHIAMAMNQFPLTVLRADVESVLVENEVSGE